MIGCFSPLFSSKRLKAAYSQAVVVIGGTDSELEAE
jgi:hypothetical protein